MKFNEGHGGDISEGWTDISEGWGGSDGGTQV